MNSSKSKLPSLSILSVAIMGAGCGRVEATPQRDDAAPPAVATAPAPSGGYRIEFPGAASNTFFASSRSVTRVSFDLAVTVKAAAPELNDGLSRMGAAISGSSDAQVRLVEIPGTEALCQSGASASVEAAANLRLGAHDVVDLSRLRIDFDLLDIRYPFESDVGVCYGTHTAVGGWTWSAGLLPIVFDSPWVYGGPDGTAHIDFPVDAKHVDSVVVVYNERVRGLFLKRITYWATGSR